MRVKRIFSRTRLGLGAALLVIFAWSVPGALAAQSTQIPLAGSAIPQFMQPLPLLSVQTGGTINTVPGNTPLTINMCEFDAKILPPGTFAVGAQPMTRVFGYIVGSCPTTLQDSYIGPVIVNQRAGATPSPTSITWVNNLGTGASTNVLAWKYSTDLTLHWADPTGILAAGVPESNVCYKNGGIPLYLSDCAQNYTGPIPAVVHLHGGEVPPELDGGPDAWYTSTGIKGHAYYTFGTPGVNEAIYNYPNTQEAAPIWFHDHALGITRLNVYAGLAGAYIITDNNLPTDPVPGNPPPADLNDPTKIIPLVIQDRMFDNTGQLFFPADTANNLLWTPNPEHPYWVPEFVGDTIVVNGKAWPFLEVGQNKYRFLFLNGSNARTYELFLPNPAGGNLPLWVIENDGGYLSTPVAVTKLTIMPGERYGVIIDFAGIPAGTNLILKNTGRTPYPKGAPPQGTTLGQIIQFRVRNPLTAGLPVAPVTTFVPTATTNLRPMNPMVRLTTGGALPATVALTRQLTLNEVLMPPSIAQDPVTGVQGTAYPGGPLEILVNNTKFGGETGWVNGNPTTRGDFKPVDTKGKIWYYSELPTEGNTEVWEIVNLTADAHPMHLHAVQFQIINRQNFNVAKYNAVYNGAFTGAGAGGPLPANCVAGTYCPGYGPPLTYSPAAGCNPATDLAGCKYGGNPNITPYVQGPVNLPLPQEAGWKDTVVTYPGQVTRLAVRWAPQDVTALTGGTFPFSPDGHGYVWHCHIIDHEDNEMMRPTQIQPISATRTLTKGTDY
jgi:FtsP/CotA-like multicopper oxidase with cupredoxin domain